MTWSTEEDLCFNFAFERFETGSRETTRGFGAGNSAISISSSTVTRLWQDMVGDMVVGLVKMDVIMYEIVPRSN